MARTSSLNEFLTDVAESIRAKKKTTNLIPASNFDTEIASIETGGGDVSEYFNDTINANGNSANYAWLQAIKKMPTIKFQSTSNSGFNASFKNFQGENLDINFELTRMPTNIESMFDSCIYLKNINGLEEFNTEEVTTMGKVFYNCREIETFNINTWNTAKANDMQSMFYNCMKIQELNLSNFGTSLVKNMNSMFYNCSSMTKLNISSFDMSEATNINNMLANCPQLTDLNFGTNLGAGYKTTVSANYSYYKLDISKSTKLTEASLISVLNGLYDIKTKGCNTQQCILGSTNLAKLTSEAGQQALAQAQSFGWMVS